MLTSCSDKRKAYDRPGLWTSVALVRPVDGSPRLQGKAADPERAVESAGGGGPTGVSAFLQSTITTSPSGLSILFIRPRSRSRFSMWRHVSQSVTTCPLMKPSMSGMLDRWQGLRRRAEHAPDRRCAQRDDGRAFDCVSQCCKQLLHAWRLLALAELARLGHLFRRELQLVCLELEAQCRGRRLCGRRQLLALGAPRAKELQGFHGLTVTPAHHASTCARMTSRTSLTLTIFSSLVPVRAEGSGKRQCRRFWRRGRSGTVRRWPQRKP